MRACCERLEGNKLARQGAVGYGVIDTISFFVLYQSRGFGFVFRTVIRTHQTLSTGALEVIRSVHDVVSQRSEGTRYTTSLITWLADLFIAILS